jgi:hypothetical protein
MADAIYPAYKEACLDGSAENLTSVAIKAALVDTGTYTYNSAHNFLNDVSGVVATSDNLTSKSVTNGTFDAADITWSSVSGSSAEAIILYYDSGSASTSRLICYIDSATGLPVTPNGGDISVTWDAGGIFTL